jgi:hypothetical protein
VPAVIDESYKTFRASVTTYKGPISQYPLASQLPSSNHAPPDTVSYFSKCESFQSLFHDPEQPQRITDYLAPAADEPILAVHITSFTDTSLLGISFPHAVLDIGGLGILMRNLQTIVNDKGSALKIDKHLPDPLVDQPLELVLSADDGPSPIAKYIKSTPKPAILASLDGSEETAPPPSSAPVEPVDTTTPMKMAYIPASVLKEWHANMQADLKEGEWISQGDVLASWWLKVGGFTRSLSPKLRWKSRTVTRAQAKPS